MLRETKTIMLIFLIGASFGVATTWHRQITKGKSRHRGEYSTRSLPEGFVKAQLKLKRINTTWGSIIMLACLAESFVVELLCLDQVIKMEPLDAGLLVALLMVPEIFILWVYLEKLARKLGFVCPHCHKSLYVPRSKILETGLCPSCNRAVT